MGYVNVQGANLPIPNRENALQVEPRSALPNAQYEDIVDINNQMTLQRAETNGEREMLPEREDAPYEDVGNVNINLGPEYQDLGERPVQVPVVYDRIRHGNI